MTARTRVSLAALALSIAVLCRYAVAGSGGARVGALFGLAGLFAGGAAAIAAYRREHADDLVPVSKAALLNELFAGPAVVFVAMAVYFGGAFLVGGTAIPIVGGVALLASLAWAPRMILRREGVERDQLLRATSFAFFVTVLGSAGYALFESFADAPRLSMWVVWMVGMFAWATAAEVLRRRAS